MLAGVVGKYDCGAEFGWTSFLLLYDGGCEKAFGCGVKARLSDVEFLTPKAVKLSSSSDWDVAGAILWSPLCAISSLELLKTRSDSLSLSSYSSWLLPAALLGRAGTVVPRVISRCKPRRWCCLGRLECCRTCRPVVTMLLSPPAEDREEEDGWDVMSTQEST